MVADHRSQEPGGHRRSGHGATSDLATAVDFILGRGASVRLVGDDQQLAAVSAGGILRDLVHHAGAVTLTRLHRFTSPTEAAATLALRVGDATALGFYADHQRIHGGDPGSALDQAYRAWQSDRANGRDALLLAPTHDIVTALNERARTDRLAKTGRPAREIPLRDGLRVSAGDLIVTRHNDRRLPISDTDWVKNGDRWRVTEVHPDGSLTATRLAGPGHPRNRVLPAAYVSQHVQLGYAATVHAAQGTTADTTHTVLSGSETRQTLYVALSRGRCQNHLYLADATDPEPQNLPHVDAAPASAEVLTSIRNRDGAQESATTTQRRLHDPALMLHESVLRYQDALGVAAEQAIGATALTALDRQAEDLWPGLTNEAAYPTLRQHLALRTLEGDDPADLVRSTLHETTSAHDIAAVLDWRLRRSTDTHEGPLPWLPAVPEQLAGHPEWASYLTASSTNIEQLAAQVFETAATWAPEGVPAWAQALSGPRHAALRGDIATWRAAFDVPEHDIRPTGPPQAATSARLHQAELEHRYEATTPRPGAARHDWRTLLPPTVLRDPHVTVLCARMNDLQAEVGEGEALLTAALTDLHPLPVEHPADAVWWRVLAVLGERSNPADSSVPERARPPRRPAPSALRAGYREAMEERHMPSPSSPGDRPGMRP